MSVVNTKLRDDYSNLEELCAAEGIDEADLTQRLAAAGFEYVPALRAFR